MSRITSHVLDTSVGRAASGLRVQLDVAATDGSFRALSERVTNDDGRVMDLLGDAVLEARTYRLTFHTGEYFAAAGRPTFYPSVSVVFAVTSPAEHHHVPLLLSPFGYSTYRGT
jgi:5-hydroxyisourate hydrolase